MSYQHWNVQPYEGPKEHAEEWAFGRGSVHEVGRNARFGIAALWQAAEWRRQDELQRPAGGGAAKVWASNQKLLEKLYHGWGVAEMLETGGNEVTYADEEGIKIVRYDG